MLGLFAGYWLGSPPGYMGGPVASGGGTVTYIGSYLGGSTGMVGGWLGVSASATFPTQYGGLRVFVPGTSAGAGYLGKYGGGSDFYFGSVGGSSSGQVVTLCLVAEADAPSGMGGVLKFRKNSTTYAIYLVATSDPNASPVRVRTTTGIKAIRLKT